MRRIALIIITVSVLYFIGGFVCVKLNWLDKEFFNESATILGGVASILGLLGFVLPGIKTSDLKNIEVQNLKKLAETAEEIQLREQELNNKRSDLQNLELQKTEMEFLIRKASISLYLKDQLENYNNQLLELISNHKELSRVIDKISDLNQKATQLDVEINNSPSASKVFELISSIKTKSNSDSDFSIDLSLSSLVANFFKSFLTQLTK